MALNDRPESTTALRERIRSALSVFTVVLLAAVAYRSVVPKEWSSSLSSRRSCNTSLDEAKVRFPQTPASWTTTKPQNRVEEILDRLWASRTDLRAFTDESGEPDTAALLGWVQNVPDSSASYVAACGSDAIALSAQTGVALSADGLPLLARLIEWTLSHTPRLTPRHLEERNRNAIFSLYQLGRISFTSTFVEKNGRIPTAPEFMKWALELSPDAPDFDNVWFELQSLELASN